MRLKHKTRNLFATGSQFNTHGIGEFIAYYEGEDGDCSSDYIKDYDVQLPDGTWKDFAQAFKDRDIIVDNYNTHFFFPTNEEDRKRGYTLS